MTGADWEPDNALERDLLTARRNDDGEAYLRRLARADLLLPVLAEEHAVGGPVSWITSKISGINHVLAFTSAAAMSRLLEEALPHRVARFVELAETWPDPAVSLAVDPGLPIEAFLSRTALSEVAEVAAEPAPGFEQTLHQAIAAGDVETYAVTLLERRVAVPVDPGGGTSRDVTDPEFPWARLSDEDDVEEALVVFSSGERLRDQLGGHPYVAVGFAEVVKAWPDRHPVMAVDPGSPLAAVIEGPLVAALAARLREVEQKAREATSPTTVRVQPTGAQRGRLAEQLVREQFGITDPARPTPVPARPTPVPVPEPRPVVTPTPVLVSGLPVASPAAGSVPAGGSGTPVQVVVLASHVDRYLQQGLRHMVGLVHRSPDGTVPLADQYSRLGLHGAGSPFQPSDQEGYVFRWYESDPEAYRKPRMDAVELSDGTSLVRIDRSGTEQVIAVYQMARGTWAAMPSEATPSEAMLSEEAMPSE